MNQQKAKLFRPLFETRQSYRKFKKAYTAAPLKIRLETILMAEKVKTKSQIRHMRIPE